MSSGGGGSGGTRWRARLRETYLTVDARSLGFGRIVLALVLLADLVRRIPDLVYWYSNQGMLANHTIVGSSRVDLQACKLEYSIVSPK